MIPIALLHCWCYSLEAHASKFSYRNIEKVCVQLKNNSKVLSWSEASLCKFKSLLYARIERSVNTLIRLSECPDGSESSFGPMSNYWFSGTVSNTDMEDHKNLSLV